MHAGVHTRPGPAVVPVTEFGRAHRSLAPERRPRPRQGDAAAGGPGGERLGFDSVWAAHHVVLPYERESKYPYQRSGTEVAMSPGMQWLDPLVTLSMIAGVTERVRLGTSVFVLPYRNPVTLAAELAALDVLSDGRLVFGVGAGWMREEFEAIGIDRRASEEPAPTSTSQVLKTLWTRRSRELRGPLHELRRTSCWPPRRAPRAARRSGSAATPTPALRRALRFGAGWHGFEVFPEEMPELRERLGAARRRRSAATPPSSS